MHSPLVQSVAGVATPQGAKHTGLFEQHFHSMCVPPITFPQPASQLWPRRLLAQVITQMSKDAGQKIAAN